MAAEASQVQHQILRISTYHIPRGRAMRQALLAIAEPSSEEIELGPLL